MRQYCIQCLSGTLKQWHAQEKKCGIILKKLRKNVDKPITAILTLNTVSNTAGAAIAGAMAATVFGNELVGYFSVFFTLAILIFSEVIPKTAGGGVLKAACPLCGISSWLARFNNETCYLDDKSSYRDNLKK